MINKNRVAYHATSCVTCLVLINSLLSICVVRGWSPSLSLRSFGILPSQASNVNCAGRTTTTSLLESKISDSAVPITLDGKEIRGPITPLGNLLLVKVKDTLTATSGGILLPDQAKERPTEGLVLEAGPGKIHPFTAVRITNPIKAGFSVLYGKFDGRAAEYKGEECQMIRDDDVLLYYTGVTMKLDTVQPVRDYVLVEIDGLTPGEDKSLMTKSGVVVAAQTFKDQVPCQGKVIKIGEGRMASMGNIIPSPVQPGDVVKFKDYAGNEVMIEGKSYSVVKMVDILCTRLTEVDTTKA